MDMEFKDKVVVVTGGGSGIGAAIAQALAIQGARVAILDYAVETAQEMVSAMGPVSGECRVFQVDVASPDSVAQAIQAVDQAYGRLDYAVNNAGVTSPYALVGDIAVPDWQRVINVNLNGVFYCLSHEIPLMLRQGGGAIVNLSSILGINGMAGRAAYAAAKHGVIGLSKSAALDYAQKGIRVNAVAPGYVDTPLLKGRSPEERQKIAAVHPMNRLAAPDEIAQVVVSLLSAKFSFMTGETIAVDGGYSAG